MLSFLNQCVSARSNQFFPLLISVSTKTLKDKPISSLSFKRRSNQFDLAEMAPSKPKIVAEYAKSNRSSCKKCSQVISAKALRLGLVTRDARGFDMTKWHHLHCFSEKIESTQSIGGFALLQSCDQDALEKLILDGGKAAVEGSPKGAEENEEEIERDKRNPKKSKMTEEDTSEIKQDRSCMTAELSTSNEEIQLKIAFSQADIKDKYKDAQLLPNWKAYQTVIFLERDDGLYDSNKIAAFDFDGCLAKTSVKRVGADAWSLMYPSIPDKLQGLYKDGYKLVIFTNESNIGRWKNKRQLAVDSKIGRLNNFIRHVKVPMQVFIACGYSDGKAEDPFRKPKPGMWQIMEKHFNSGISVDMDQSFYVGDAAGRINDHSDADIKFAQTIGLKFFVPEDYFGA